MVSIHSLYQCEIFIIFIFQKILWITSTILAWTTLPIEAVLARKCPHGIMITCGLGVELDSNPLRLQGCKQCDAILLLDAKTLKTSIVLK